MKEARAIDVIQIVGFDGELAGKQAILDGKIYADPIQFPKQMGQGIVAKLIAYQAVNHTKRLHSSRLHSIRRKMRNRS